MKFITIAFYFNFLYRAGLSQISLKLRQNLKHVTLAYNQGKYFDHIIFYVYGFHGYLFLA